MRQLVVLVVDDNRLNAELATALLGAAGHQVEVAMSGAEFRTRMLRAEVPDIVLMDSVLPDSTGSELLAEARAVRSWATVPMLAVTAQALSGDRERLLRDGFERVVTKPIDTREFVALVERHARHTSHDD